VNFVVLTGLINILGQSVLDIAVQTLNIEIHVVLMELLQRLRFCFHITINSKEGWDLVLLDVDQVLVGQVLKQNVTPISSMISQTVQDARLLLNIWSRSHTIFIVPIVRFLLIFYELIETILFIVLVAVLFSIRETVY
jgi:hypothetical protein